MTRSIFRLSLALAFLGFCLSAVQFAGAQNALPTGTTQITGVVLDAQRRPVGDAQVRLSGPISETTSTAGDGSFTFRNLPSGIFRLDISKAGFNPATQDDIVTAVGSTTNLGFTLQAASLTSLTVIGSVSVTAHGANTINTTPASIVDVPATTFTDQGQLSVNQVLNEEPGITIGLGSPNTEGEGYVNGGSPSAWGVPSIRGGLPYETESLIDGHPIALGENGEFSPSYISPYLLQNVEVVKGPGATSPSINYAINGTVNYRTLEPTLKPEESVDLGEDQYGGNFANFRATGTLPGGHLSYAFDYVTQGTQGPDRGFTPPETACAGSVDVNGKPINAFGDFGVPAGPPNFIGSFNLTDGLLISLPFSMDEKQTNELGKIRYAFTPSTTLTLSWLGSQNTTANDAGLPPFANVTFTPPAGYAGSLPAGLLPAVFPGFRGSDSQTQDMDLFETEFHTPLGKTATLLLRQYSSSIQTFQGGPGDSGPTAGSSDSETGAVWGAVYFLTPTASVCNSTPVLIAVCNGQIATVTENDTYFEHRSYNDLNGYTAEIDKQAGDDLLSLSYDEEKTSTYATNNCSGTGFAVTFPAGSSQTFQSVMGRAQFELGQSLNGTLSDNFGSYTDVYSQNDGLTFQSATHTYQAPRLSLTWRPNVNQSVRASIGTSIAPPYIALLNNNDTISAAGVPPTFYTETENSGDVLPETAFGFDVGLDTRLHSPFTVLSVDAYQTLLHNQFLSSTTQDGTLTCNNINVPCNQPADTSTVAPLYVTKTANLGHSEYEGVELSLHRTPPTGWGYRIQGSLMRAFVYDLPAGFYNTATCTNCTNLGILPNTNFQTDAFGYNSMSSARVPYSMGYGEINYRGGNGAYFLAGIMYYGPNNSYNEPAFGVVTVSFDQPLTQRISLELSIYNLTNAYPNFFYDNGLFGGSGVNFTPLENGQLGTVVNNVVGPSTARLTLHVDL